MGSLVVVTGHGGWGSTGGLFSVPLEGQSTASDPGDLAPQSPAEVDRSPMERHLCGCGPQFELVPVAVTAMAVVAAERHVHGEGATTFGWRRMQGTATIPLRARATYRLKREQVEHLLHRDLGTQPVEVDAGHGTVLRQLPGPFPFPLYI